MSTENKKCIIKFRNIHTGETFEYESGEYGSEDMSIMKMVKERDARDTGKRYSHEEVVKKINKRLEGELKEDE